MADNIIQSTSQAILFEEFRHDDNTKSLNTMLDNEEEGVVETSDFAADVNQELSVKSFKEFLQKFAPKIYEICIDGKFIYTTDAVKANRYKGIEKSITDNTYYQMLADMYNRKGKSGQSNMEFDDSQLLEMLAPQREVKEAARLRKNLKYITEKFNEARDNGEDSSEYWNKICTYRNQIVDKYQNSVISLLPLALDDVNQQIQVLESGQNNDVDSEANEPQLLSSGHGEWSFDTEGRLSFLPAKASKDETEFSDETSNGHNINTEICAMITADYDAYHPGNEENEFVKNLMIATYAPVSINEGTADAGKQLAELKERKQTYETVYTDAKSAFINELSSIIEKVLGVMVFFDHATASGGDTGMLESRLIVANCKPADLVDSRLHKKFKKYVNYIGRDLGNDKCWFGILPSVHDETVVNNVMPQSDFDFSQPINRTTGQMKKEKMAGDVLTLNVAKILLQDLDEAHIMTVFNSKPGKENTFSRITADYIQGKEASFDRLGINYAHASYAYPNFTLMRERHISITDNKGGAKIVVPGIYIDAAYPAAGLLVASQQYKCLRARGLSEYIITDMENMNFVHIDLESKLVQEHLTTKFNRENVMNWSQSVLNAITESMFGFAFCGDEKAGDVQNTYVFTARTLKKMDSQKYKPIYRVLVNDFIYALTVCVYKKRREEINNELINKLVPMWTSAANRFADKPKINLVLKKGEWIRWTKDDPKQLAIKFIGDTEILNEIVINDETNDETNDEQNS